MVLYWLLSVIVTELQNIDEIKNEIVIETGIIKLSTVITKRVIFLWKQGKWKQVA